MSLASRQVTKEVDRIVEDRMKDGYMPTIDYITSKLTEFYKENPVGLPTFKMRKQPYRRLWGVDNWNDNLDEIYNDLHNLYEEMIDQFTIVLEDFDYYDTERRKLMHQIKELDAELKGLLLVAGDTAGYLYAVGDTFIDRSKVNLEYTTCEINTDAGIVTLRESRQGIEKLDMSHYFDVVNYPILAEKEYADYIHSNKLFPQSKFGYAFSDINTSWTQGIITTQGGELKVSFIIELTPGSDWGELISRIEMLGHSSKPMYVQPLYSIDNINFVKLESGSQTEEKAVTDGKKTVWNFAEIRARYLKFIIRKEVEDETVPIENIPGYSYVVGFKHIEIFKMGYDATSTFYSQPFEVEDPTGELLTIDKAALITDQDVPPGTRIEYYLSLGVEGITDPNEYNWVAVSPINIVNPSEQQLVDFRHVAFFNNLPDVTWDESLYDTPVDSYQGIDFYKIYEFPYEPVKDSVTLYRGKNNWQVTEKYEVLRKAVYDEEHSFGSGETITLNFPTTDPVEGEGIIRGTVVVKSEPGTNPAYTYVNPSDYTINYTTKVITKPTGSSISDDPQSPTNTVYVDYEYDKEVADPTVFTTYIYILNRDGLDINIIPFTQAEREAGQYLYIDTSEGTQDLSAETFFHIPPGWHKVATTAQPQTSDDRFYGVNDNKYLYEKVYKQYAYAEKLQEFSWFNLKYNTKKLDHGKYAIVDIDNDGTKEIIVNYRPQTTIWTSSDDDLLCPAGAETYVLNYKFISTITDKIYLKAIFSREDGVSNLITPTLREYTIKLGY